MSLRELLVVVAVLLLAVALFWRPGASQRSAFHASVALTPGALNPDVTQETIGSTICVRGWTRTIRPPASFTDELKLRQMKEYGVGGSPSDYQEDHLVSLELGGDPRDPRNLWPEPRARAETVDSIENDLNAKVCSGEMSLVDAQRKIAAIKHTDG